MKIDGFDVLGALGAILSALAAGLQWGIPAGCGLMGALLLALYVVRELRQRPEGRV